MGFLGLGWIGQARLRALVDADLVDVVAVADPRAENATRAAADLPGVAACRSLDELLEQRLDGVVIATPSAMHADQAIACLEHRLAVFCQKPMARSGEEAARVVRAARTADRRLAVDMSYRHTAAMRALKRVVDEGSLGSVHTADLVFHNAYGPDQSWYYARDQAGGGCLIDLGVHLLDQLAWLLGWSEARVLDARLRSQGHAWNGGGNEVEDFAHIVLEGPDHAVARVTCSWRAPVGCDARIGIELIGSAGGARMMNVGGSFYDFVAEQWSGTKTTTLAQPPDAWGGRAIVEWGRAIGANRRYDPDIEDQLALSATIDRIYAHAGGAAAMAPVALGAER